MKISLYLPAGTKNMGTFISDELSTAKNIKSDHTRKSVVSNLNKISSSL